MKKVCVVTATRAEYGLLKPVIQGILQDGDLDLSLLVTGAHLSEMHGFTINEIIKDGFPIARQIPMELSDTGPEALNREMAKLQAEAGGFFMEEKPDLLLLLGDRYEMLSIAAAAMMCRIPIGHIHGGETTQGAIDEAIRHAITKMSYLHFTSIPEYRKRVIQLGEAPERVFTVGALGVENIKKLPLLGEEEIRKVLQIEPGRPYAMVTFHPVTLEADGAKKQLGELLGAMEKEETYEYAVTFANADSGGNELNQLWKAAAAENGHIHLFFFPWCEELLKRIKIYGYGDRKFLQRDSGGAVFSGSGYQYWGPAEGKAAGRLYYQLQPGGRGNTEGHEKGPEPGISGKAETGGKSLWIG